ncbi:MAG: hypothetical protein HC767_12000 [Akkermansiaceae bacterium]|nr:hypothetical protein [Akkermansiaceae bacterium]
MERINERSGSTFEAKPVGNPNGRGNADTNGVANACGVERTRRLFNETTLYNIASQYARDVISFGYM